MPPCNIWVTSLDKESREAPSSGGMRAMEVFDSMQSDLQLSAHSSQSLSCLLCHLNQVTVFRFSQIEYTVPLPRHLQISLMSLNSVCSWICILYSEQEQSLSQTQHWYLYYISMLWAVQIFVLKHVILNFGSIINWEMVKNLVWPSFDPVFPCLFQCFFFLNLSRRQAKLCLERVSKR